MNHNQKAVADAYFAAVFFTDSGEPSDPLTGEEEISDEAREQVTAEIDQFLSKAGDLVDGWTAEQIGHNLWLDRNGHGTGFWDRDLPNGNELSNIAKEMGFRWPYAGDDGLLYFSK